VLRVFSAENSVMISIARSAALSFLMCAFAHTHASDPTQEMQRIGKFEIDRTEVTIAQFQRFVDATKFVTAAERAGGGSTFENGWEQRKGWTWRTPFGTPAKANEPAVHLNYDEAAAYCKWTNKRLPTDAEWGEAAYIERRAQPTDGFVTGRTYRFPTGDSPQGANCLGDCGNVKTVGNAVTSRGRGHAEAGTTKRGVNGLYDMGANAWEWVDSGGSGEKRTRGGSWWYGASSMRDDHVQSKPTATSVVYIGFRCARDVR
jgi:formylglycine-generating enzyme